jgi:hypothetical protein
MIGYSMSDFSNAQPGDGVYVDGDWSTTEGTFVAGPFEDIASGFSTGKILVQLPKGLTLVFVRDARPKPVRPIKGQTWIHKKNDGKRIIDELVDDRYVIVKHHENQHDSRSSLHTLQYFLQAYRLDR